MKRMIRFIPAILWMTFIFYLSTRQTIGIGGNSYWWRFLILKSFHIIEFAILVIFLFYAINHYYYSLLIGVIYALSDEFHQMFTIGRNSSLRDILFDLSGIFLGLLIINIILKIDWLKNIVLQKKIK